MSIGPNRLLTIIHSNPILKKKGRAELLNYIHVEDQLLKNYAIYLFGCPSHHFAGTEYISTKAVRSLSL